MPRVTEESMAGFIKTLAPGQSYSRSRRFPLDGTAALDIPANLAKLRALVNNAVARMRREDEGTSYRVESAAAMTTDYKAIICTVCVTRMVEGEDTDTDDI